MGDRGTVQFEDENGQVYANVYTHWFGSRISEMLDQFFEAEESGGRDSRYADPSYLAARFVEFASDGSGMGIGLLPANSRQGYCDWTVVCDTSHDVFSGKAPARPLVKREDQE